MVYVLYVALRDIIVNDSVAAVHGATAPGAKGVYIPSCENKKKFPQWLENGAALFHIF